MFVIYTAKIKFDIYVNPYYFNWTGDNVFYREYS